MKKRTSFSLQYRHIFTLIQKWVSYGVNVLDFDKKMQDIRTSLQAIASRNIRQSSSSSSAQVAPTQVLPCASAVGKHFSRSTIANMTLERRSPTANIPMDTSSRTNTTVSDSKAILPPSGPVNDDHDNQRAKTFPFHQPMDKQNHMTTSLDAFLKEYKRDADFKSHSPSFVAKADGNPYLEKVR
jgi:hypothetical protein